MQTGREQERRERAGAEREIRARALQSHTREKFVDTNRERAEHSVSWNIFSEISIKLIDAQFLNYYLFLNRARALALEEQLSECQLKLRETINIPGEML